MSWFSPRLHKKDWRPAGKDTEGFRRQTQLRNNLEWPAEEEPETISLAVRVEDETYQTHLRFSSVEDWGLPETALIGLA